MRADRLVNWIDNTTKVQKPPNRLAEVTVEATTPKQRTVHALPLWLPGHCVDRTTMGMVFIYVGAPLKCRRSPMVLIIWPVATSIPLGLITGWPG